MWRGRRHEGEAEKGDNDEGGGEEAPKEEDEGGRVEGRDSGNGTGCNG